MNSTTAIHSFKSDNKLLDKHARLFNASVIVVNEFEECIYDDTCECSFTYNEGYFQDEINIIWKLNDVSAKALGLHGRYNTNHQEFEYTDGKLIVYNNGLTISIEYKGLL